jgi:hypothetical protein
LQAIHLFLSPYKTGAINVAQAAELHYADGHCRRHDHDVDAGLPAADLATCVEKGRALVRRQQLRLHTHVINIIIIIGFNVGVNVGFYISW